MELNANDLLRIKDISSLVGHFQQNPWIDEAVKRAPLVVVRRAPIINDMVPVGIRGSDRNQRCAAIILCSTIIDRITPEQLAEGKLWRTNKHIRESQLFPSLEMVDAILSNSGIAWGLTGSVGFELASGVPTATITSDLDIVIRVPSFLAVKTAKKLTTELAQVPIQVDIQIETPKGGVALTEYARGDNPVLLRTVNGPKLVTNPWSEDEAKLESDVVSSPT